MPRPSTPGQPQMPRSPAQWQSKKLRWPKPAASKKPKLLVLQPSGMLRSRRPSRKATPKGIWQNHVGLGGASYPWGEQKSSQLLLCLPGHSVHQPSRVQEHSGGLLPHFIGADTSISPICPITKGLSSGGTAQFSHSSSNSAQTVS